MLAGIAVLLVFGSPTPVEAHLRLHRSENAIDRDGSIISPREEAYFTARVRKPRPPRGNHSGWVDDDEDNDDTPRRASFRENQI